MAFKAQRLLILLVCFGFLLLLQPVKGSGLRSINSLLRWTKENQVAVSPVAQMPATSAEKKKPSTKNKRIGANGSTDDDAERKQVSVNNKVDPYQSSKRKVQRGSDPIHNRS